MPKRQRLVILSVPETIHQRLLLTAIDLDHCSINKMRQIRGEVDDKTGDLVTFGNAPQRDTARGERISLLARDFHVAGHRINEAGPALGTNGSGINRHKADIVPAVLRSERKCQVLPGSVRRARPISQ